MTQLELAVWLFIVAFLIMLLGYNLPKTRTLLVSMGFFTLMSAAFGGYSNWLPQTRGEVPEETSFEGDITALPVEELAAIGEKIIFGDEGLAKRGIGKGQCPLCHTFAAGQIGDRAPNLIGISNRAAERVKEDRYEVMQTSQTEAFSGSGRAQTAIEYIAESHTCPSCYVVEGFGVKGTNDKESPMPAVHKAPINLKIDELVAVDTWMWYREGLEPPDAATIKAAYEKFIPEGDPARESPGAEEEKPVAGLDPKKLALKDDSPDQIVQKMGCFACHRIPTIEFAKTGAVGPLLIEGENAARRIKSPEYKEAMKAGKAFATTPKEYVIESIMDPSAFIVPGFPAPGGKSLMPPNFGEKFTYAAVSKLADFLLSLDAQAAIKDGLDRVPMEKEGSLKKAAVEPQEGEALRQVKAESEAQVF